ncbi:MAG TPA: ABC transporter ATP-binding protein [Pseudolabrys sp.]|nr:ABC transporter ATP-binding protein [Pseudolabrys sp.]
MRFDSVLKRFGEVVALHEVSLAIRRGEFMTLLGPSGCGKTTLLNLVAGFFSPDGGRILVDGELVNDVPTYKREIGMMFQNYALFPHMSVAANVAYGLKMRGIAKDEIARRVKETLTLVKLTGMEDRRPRQLSGGQQQRVALARALVINPKVLLLDEPFSALDRNLRASMQVELREIQSKLGVTTIFVTHDQGEALSLSDRIAVMSEGRIRQVGAPAEVYAMPNERFVASFVGDANILRCRLERIDGVEAIVALGQMQARVPAAPIAALTPTASVDLFLRPEQLQVSDLEGPETTTGTVAAHVFQGGHVDIYLDCSDCISGRLLIRMPGHEAAGRWPVGSRVKIAVKATNVVAFPPA